MNLNILAEANTETYTYIFIVLGVLLIIGIALLFVIKEKPVSKSVDLEFILTLFDKENILNVDFIRNKIVMEFKDVTTVDVEALHEKGALGVSIIGDKIKFYFDGGNDRNESLYKEIKNFIGR